MSRRQLYPQLLLYINAIRVINLKKGMQKI